MASPGVPGAARDAILAWFEARGRTFPFRGVRDPYAILVSEAMAQQTQIARASGKWTGFMARFPTLEALAAATPADVLREWRGLGYNRRALNLWRAAGAIVERHGGRVPSDLEELERLPGVGPYTARAVAALAFGRAVGAVDTNVRRVLVRMTTAPDGPAPTAREVQQLADATVPAERPGDWTHALMDVGATCCKPVRPRCADCPVRPWCRFAAAGGGGATRPSERRRTPQRQDVRFPATSRWLRGRLLDRLREAAGESWRDVGDPIGEHDGRAVEAALAALARDGLVERHPSDARLARLPTA